MGTHRRDGSARVRSTRKRSWGERAHLALYLVFLIAIFASIAGVAPQWIARHAFPLLLVMKGVEIGVEWWRTRHDRPQRQRMLPRLDPDYRRRR